MSHLRNNIQVPDNSKILETLELAELGKKARIVFHDLSNHITSLTLSISHLEESLEHDRERLREYSERSARARREMEFVAELLRAHLKNSGNTRFNLSKEITQIMDVFSSRASLENIDLVLNLDKEIEIQGQKSDFAHIVGNLVTNALEAFETAPATRQDNQQKIRRIDVSLWRNSGQANLSIADTGCGIKNENIGKIFQQNFTTKKSGHGIGLFTVKEYVERSFGGKIRVISSDTGTEFLVTIPRIFDAKKQNRKRLALPASLKPQKILTATTDSYDY